LDDIENIIEELQRKSNDLLSNAEKLAIKLAEEARVKELSENIHKLSRKKLEFKAKETVKRNRSFKGILGPFL
jgi:hypothetical protein